MKSTDLSLNVRMVPEEAFDTDPLEAGETREDVVVKLSPRYPPKLQRKIAQAIERTIHQNADMLVVLMNSAAAKPTAQVNTVNS